MTEMYKCDYCGYVYETMEECSACEEGHKVHAIAKDIIAIDGYLKPMEPEWTIDFIENILYLQVTSQDAVDWIEKFFETFDSISPFKSIDFEIGDILYWEPGNYTTRWRNLTQEGKELAKLLYDFQKARGD